MRFILNAFSFSSFVLFLLCFPGCNQEAEYELHDQMLVDTKPENSNQPVELRGGVMVEPSTLTVVDTEQLAARDGHMTTLMDPTGAVWELSAAEGLEPGDFREAGFTPSLDTVPAFYHRRVDYLDNEDMTPDCVVYIEAGSWQHAVLRRGEDQGACPTTEEYVEWLPQATLRDSEGESGQYANKHAALAFGVQTGSFNGVNSYSNSYASYYCPDFKPWSQCTSYVGNQLAGIKWQCVEYTDRYYLSVYNHTNLWKGHAKYWYSKAPQYGLKSYPNCGSTKPQPGDMLVSTSGPFGHIAIVRSVGLLSVSVIQQNWFQSEKDNSFSIPITYLDGKFCVKGFSSSYPVAGWIRK